MSPTGSPTGTPAAPRLVPVADRALLVEFADEISEAATDAVMAMDRLIGVADITGVTEVVPAYVNVLVVFDPMVTDHREVGEAVLELLAQPATTVPPPTVHEVTVCYHDALAPDLPAVASACGLGVDAVVAAHLAGDYRVVMYGFAPGYAYLAGVSESIRVPRKPAPVRGIAAGSVIIAGPQCLITTIEMPTGWSVIGRSATRVLQADAVDPFRFDPGDRVVFRRVDLATFERLAATS